VNWPIIQEGYNTGMEHFIEALLALVWAKIGSELRGQPLVDAKYSSFKVVHVDYHSKEYFFETYEGYFGTKHTGSEFQLAEKTFRKGAIPINFRWLSDYDLEVTYSFSGRERKLLLQFANEAKEMVIVDEDQLVEGRADANNQPVLSYVKFRVNSYDKTFQVHPF
jgi:hypothetical protein